MSTICSAPQKPYKITHNQNKFNSSNNYYNMGKTNGKFNHKNNFDKYPKNNQKIIILRTTHYKSDRKRQTINPIKILPPNQGFNNNYSNTYPIKVIKKTRYLTKIIIIYAKPKLFLKIKNVTKIL